MGGAEAEGRKSGALFESKRGVVDMICVRWRESLRRLIIIAPT